MQQICRNCLFSKDVDKKLVGLSKRIAEIKTDKTILNKEKKDKLETEKLLDNKVVNVEDLATNESKFIGCENEDHLKDIAGSGEVSKLAIHKYYFSCPHFKEKKE